MSLALLKPEETQEEITHVDQMTMLAFLKDVKGFNPISDGHCVITDFPIKAQAYASYDQAHAALFKSGQEFSDWVNQHTGVVTRAIGGSIIWEKISKGARKKLLRYGFCHTEEQLHCSVYNRKFFKQ